MVLTSALELDLLEIISKNVALPWGQLSPSDSLSVIRMIVSKHPSLSWESSMSLMSLRKLFLIPVYVLNTLGEICF
uniref:Uncharacterized protein n=1 Tax=Brassica campestris TaxID=3711 RepID=A0A3P5Z5I7_BRACM|nr:unnamed protein product [Brassica rapa]